MAKLPTQKDATRIVRGVIAAGVPVERIREVRAAPDGTVRVLFGESDPEPPAPTASANPFD